MKELTKKLGYDIPVSVAEQFKNDCEVAREVATHVLIKLMQEYGEKVKEDNNGKFN